MFFASRVFCEVIGGREVADFEEVFFREVVGDDGESEVWKESVLVFFFRGCWVVVVDIFFLVRGCCLDKFIGLRGFLKEGSGRV